MKFLIVFVALFALAVASPVNPDADAVVLRQDADVGPENFKYAVETSNGINAESEGHLEGQGTEEEGIEVRGSFSHVGPDGVTYTVTYTAGKDGYQPQGAHLPVAPEA
ncbi:flexible cuticle protein 12-like [Drosophila sulfurigaster albostrigata]|uniref:flexible cuticle protein 12-like n=1 Tax=Drosophila sulfurigaster albostrigata TaxID=89887 RepID=UPI002D218A2F|nr:flexible cuticle protein 12-like [Drosophila sulfurigaster albostrigata]